MSHLMSPPQAEWLASLEVVLHHLLKHWRGLVTFALCGAITGVATALLLPSYYRADTAFQADASGPTQLGGALAGLASQLGALQPGTQSSPQFFADLLTTDAVLRRVARARFPHKGAMATLPEVYGYSDKATPWQEYYTVKRLRKALGVDLNVRTGVVRFSVEARTPELALSLAETTLAALNEANVSLRQARAAAERSFTGERAEYARRELAHAESTLTTFYERNRAIASSPTLQMDEASLRRAVEMAQQVYVQMRLQEEQAAVQEVRNTPAISVIDPPSLPLKRSWPKRQLAAMIGFTIGLLAQLLRISTGG